MALVRSFSLLVVSGSRVFGSLDDYPIRNAPLEPNIPKFNNLPYGSSSPYAPAPDSAMSKSVKRSRRGRPFKKVTASQAISGALLGGCCSVALVKFVLAAYEQISLHPIAHDLPFGLTEDVNQLLSTTMIGFGGLAIAMFGVSSIGLALLSLKLISAESGKSSQVIFMTGVFLLLNAFAIHKSGIAYAQPEVEIRTRFQQSCSGCHVGGGNILQPGAGLTSEDLRRNGYNTEEEIFDIIYSGKGRMPGYGVLCTPRGKCTFGPRLSDDDIRALAKFVQSSSIEGWSAGGD